MLPLQHISQPAVNYIGLMQSSWVDHKSGPPNLHLQRLYGFYCQLAVFGWGNLPIIFSSPFDLQRPPQAWRQRPPISYTSLAITQWMDHHIPQKHEGPGGCTSPPHPNPPVKVILFIFSPSISFAFLSSAMATQEMNVDKENPNGRKMQWGGLNLHWRTRTDLVRPSVTGWREWGL